VGLLVLLIRVLGLRAREAIELIGADLTPAAQHSHATSAALVALGVRRRTKNKRIQCRVVDATASFAQRLIAHMRAMTADHERLTRLMSTAQLNHLLFKACRIVGVYRHWTIHSARSGWATDAYLNGVPFTNIKDAGGWASDSALRIYLDAVAAKTLEADSETLAAARWASLVERDLERLWKP